MSVSYGSTMTIGTANWDGIGDGARAASAIIDNSTNLFHAASLEITLDTGGTAPSASNPYWEVWLEGSVDGGTTFGDVQGVPLASIEAPSTADTPRTVILETDNIIATLPEHSRIVVVNRLGNAMGADNDLRIKGKNAS